jgi:hypothetical protein
MENPQYASHQDSTYNSCLLISYGVGTALAICMFLVYEIVGITYIVTNYYLSRSCSGSRLWEYAVTSLVFQCVLVFLVMVRDSSQDIGTYFRSLWCMTVIYIAFSIWGGFELFRFTCQDVRDSGIYYFALVSFIVQIFGATIIALMPCLIILLAQTSEITNDNTEYNRAPLGNDSTTNHNVQKSSYAV